MKKHAQADALAARLADAANKPVTVIPLVSPAPPPGEPQVAAHESTEVRATPDSEPRRSQRRKAKADAQSAEEPDEDTVPISLRPRRELLTRYVLAASERTRETGRVISAQQIMLERLEKGP